MRMGLVAAALAFLAFVIAGHFLGGDDSARATRVDDDASPADVVDAAPATADDGSAGAKTPPDRVRKKRKRRKKRNTEKKNRRK